MKIPYKKIEIPNKIKKHLKIPNKKIKDGVSPALREQRFGRGGGGGRRAFKTFVVQHG